MCKRFFAGFIAGLGFLFAPVLALLPPALVLSPAASAAVEYLSFATDDEANTTEVFSNASPSVVYVTSTALRRQMFSLNVLEIPQGAGSGFVWDDSGLIVTNYHVVARANKLTVTLSAKYLRLVIRLVSTPHLPSVLSAHWAAKFNLRVAARFGALFRRTLPSTRETQAVHCSTLSGS